MQVVDFHAHILPEMDDGSKNVQMSIEMLNRMREQGVDTVVATPHFYGHRESVSRFLNRRRVSYEKLCAECSEDLPNIMLGAEVAFFSGLSELEDLNKLCVEDTDVLLVEMPFAPWTGYEYDAIVSLCLDRHLRVVLVHYERFAKMQLNNTYYEKILRLPVKIQISAESLLPVLKRQRWLNMFRDGTAQLLGSDCHNLSNRAPNLGIARGVVKKKLGERVLDEIDRQSLDLLNH